MLGYAAAVYFGIMFFVWHISALYKEFGWFTFVILIGEFLVSGWVSEQDSKGKKDKP